MSSLSEYLDRFQALVQNQSPSSAPTSAFPWVWTYQGSSDHSGSSTDPKVQSFHIGASVMIHGNEIGPLEGLLDIMEALEYGRLPYSGRFTCFIGNPEAGLQNQRFLDHDLNRVFEGSSPIKETDSHEQRRAKELCPLLDQFDLYIDFHQTLLDVQSPFYIGPWNRTTWHWIRLMQGAQLWVTRPANQGGGGFLCADEYVRQRGKPSIALELGALGWNPLARSGVWKCLSQAFRAVEQNAYQGTELELFSQSRPDLEFYQTSYRHPFHNPQQALREGWINFSPVHQGQRLTPNHDEESPVFASCDGAILFPKYPPRDEKGSALDPRPKELFRIVQKLNQHPCELWEE